MTRQPTNPIERKLQMAGGSTFNLSLPREWGDEHGLSKGDTLYIYPNDDRVIVAPSTIDDESNTARIDVADIPKEGVKQRIRGAYTAGCDRIVVPSDGPTEADPVRLVTDTVRNLIGMAVQTVTDDEVVIQDHLDSGVVSVPQSAERIRLLAAEMQRDAVAAVRTDDDTLARVVHERDDEVDRLFAFVSRCFSRGLVDVNELDRLNVTRKEAFHYYKLARELERVADKAERIADVAVAQSSQPADDLGRRFEELVNAATDVVILALADDTDGALDAHRTVTDRLAPLDDRLAAGGDPDAYRYGRDLVESARQTSTFGLNIVNMNIEASVTHTFQSEREEHHTRPRPTTSFGRGTN